MSLEDSKDEAARYRQLSPFLQAMLIIFSILGISLAIIQIFMLRPPGVTFIDTCYYYSLMACFLSFTFIIFPVTKSAKRDKVPWYDYGLFFLSLGALVYFAFVALRIIGEGWEIQAPPLATVLCIGLWLMALEAIRRTSGIVLFITCAFFSFFPLFANHMPGFLEGLSFSLPVTARYHVMSTVSMLGIPMQALGNLVIGFIIFGSALQITGGGQFFLDFAMAVAGGSRGGPAKVSVISSSLFGTMSGSVISNVLVDGPFTIPAMKKVGYSAPYAAAIEAVTSTGGALMPPVMGAVAFIMAAFLAIPYATVAICATVPAILYYAAIFFQIDAYAAKTGMKGLPADELPRLWVTLKNGWLFIFSLLALVVMILVFKAEARAPFTLW